MKKKIRAKKVNDFCSVSKFHKWNINLGDSFNEGDVIYILDNLNEKHEIKAEINGILTDMIITENCIIEDDQVLGEFITCDESDKEYDPLGVGLVYKIVNKIKNKKKSTL